MTCLTPTRPAPRWRPRRSWSAWNCGPAGSPTAPTWGSRGRRWGGVAEKPGTFVNWEGRPGTFKPVLDVPGVESDLHVLRRIADEMDVHLGLPDAAAARRELAGLGVVGGSGSAAEAVSSETA